MTTQPAYRVDWWLPLSKSPGEWGGRWEPARDAFEARTIAMEALGEGAALAQVLLTSLGAGGELVARAVVDASALAAWDLAAGSLPRSDLDQDGLPPLGREGLVHSILSRCRRVLIEGVAAGLLETAVVSAIVEIIDHAFVGVGAAVEAASARDARVSPGDLG